MPRDTLEHVSVQAGSTFEQNGAYPISQPTGPELDTIGGGDMCLHQGVPHVAWCEVVNFGESVDGFAHWFGPYVARWNGDDWELVAPPALPEGIDPTGSPADWPFPDLATTCPAIARTRVKITSDGDNLFLGVQAAVSSRLRTTPDGSPFTFYQYFAKFLVYGFVLVGGAWTPLGDPIYGMFPNLALDPEPYGTTVIFWDLSVDAAAPGNYFFAMSDYGQSFSSLEPNDHWHLSVVGNGIPETSLATDSSYILSADGAGPTAALYYQSNFGEPPFRHEPDHVTVWTPSGSGTILATALDTGFPTTIFAPTVIATFGGVRYAVFPATVDRGFGREDRTIIQKIDPAAPFAVQHLYPDPYHTPGDPLNLDLLQISGPFLARMIVLEPRNIWVGFLSSGFGGVADNLDLVCSQRTAWDSTNINSSSFIGSRFVVYQDALWWFNILPDPDSGALTASVFRTPICRGCTPCPAEGFHFWRRANLGRGSRGAN